MSKYAVTINFRGHYGYIEYDEATREAQVHFPLPEQKEAVETYLAEKQTFEIPCGDTIREFQEVTMDPLESLDNFQTCLTRMWMKTQVRVEWSMPPGMAEHL